MRDLQINDWTMQRNFNKFRSIECFCKFILIYFNKFFPMKFKKMYNKDCVAKIVTKSFFIGLHKRLIGHIWRYLVLIAIDR